MNWNTFTFDLEGTGTRVTGAELDGKNWFLFSDLLKAFDLEDLDEKIIERLVDKGQLDLFSITSEDDNKIRYELFVNEDGGLRLALHSETPPAQMIKGRFFEAISESRKALNLSVPEFLQAGFSGVNPQELVQSAKGSKESE